MNLEKKEKVYLKEDVIKLILPESEGVNSFLEKFCKAVFKTIQETKKSRYTDWKKEEAEKYSVERIIQRLEQLESYKNKAQRPQKTEQNTENFEIKMKKAA